MFNQTIWVASMVAVAQAALPATTYSPGLRDPDQPGAGDAAPVDAQCNYGGASYAAGADQQAGCWIDGCYNPGPLTTPVVTDYNTCYTSVLGHPALIDMEHYKKEQYIVAAENDAERLKWCNRAFDDEVDDLNITTDDGYSTTEYNTLVGNVNRALTEAAYDFATLRDGVGLAAAQSSSSDFTSLAKSFAD